MTFQKLEAFARMWKKNPPPHVSLGQINQIIKAWLGVKGKDDPAEKREPILPGFMTQPDIEE
jgi:hypothetical protein